MKVLFITLGSRGDVQPYVASQVIRRRARELGRKLLTEDGVARAIDFIDTRYTALNR